MAWIFGLSINECVLVVRNIICRMFRNPNRYVPSLTKILSGKCHFQHFLHSLVFITRTQRNFTAILWMVLLSGKRIKTPTVRRICVFNACCMNCEKNCALQLAHGSEQAPLEKNQFALVLYTASILRPKEGVRKPHVCINMHSPAHQALHWHMSGCQDSQCVFLATRRSLKISLIAPFPGESYQPLPLSE